jgi:hypothetical protein
MTIRRSMSTVRGRFVAIAAGVILTSVSVLIGISGVRGQVPNWPNWNNLQGQVCNPGGANCAVCGPPGVVVGCTSGIPVGWSIGTCPQAANMVCTASNFNCGPQITCATGFPNGNVCPAPLICR